MPDELVNKLHKHFGFNDFLKGQQEVISLVEKKESAAAIFPTGSGKSLCYQLPAITLENMTLVVSPLLSLMKDQMDFLAGKNIPAARLDSTLTRDQYNSILQKAKSGDIKILMISVERFKNERFRTHLKEMKISLLVVDEAHCISEWGHNFRPEYIKLPLYRQEFNIPQVLLLTATAAPPVVDDMCKKFNIPRHNVIVTGFYRDNLHLQVTPCPGDQKKQHLLNRLSERPEACSIVYVTQQKTADQVAELLNSNGFNAASYHAGMKSDEREAVQDDFMTGKTPVVTATIAFGMGIDKADIRRVFHYNLPKSLESYSQEIGRAGRDGKKSLCEVLADRDNINVLENFVYGDTPEASGVKDVLTEIKNNPANQWEVKAYTLSVQTNIRLLPLKTLLVYLELHNIIKPKYTYFEDYSFKFLQESDAIVNRFKGERKQLVQAMFDFSQTKKVWTSIDIKELLNNYRVERSRVIKALEYFDQQGWIELRSGQAVDVYDILTKNIEVDNLTEQLLALFEQKEKREIQRIQTMLRFFASEHCLSRNLSLYFGEKGIDGCGHCSVCEYGKAIIPPASPLSPLTTYNFQELTSSIYSVLGTELSTAVLTKFLCGIHAPMFTKKKIKQLPEFGRLEDYPYKEVEKWVGRNTS
jgi:ATP-dependent DNA helicase RecQ